MTPIDKNKKKLTKEYGGNASECINSSNDILTVRVAVACLRKGCEERKKVKSERGGKGRMRREKKKRREKRTRSEKTKKPRGLESDRRID